jgi:hypothetical protein
MSSAISQATIAFTVPSATAKLAELKAFCLSHNIAVSANKSYKASYQAAIESWNQSQLKASAIKAAEVLAVEVEEVAAIVQPPATAIENAVIEYGTIAVEYATSPEAISVYRMALLWTVVGVSIVLSVTYTALVGAWILLMDLAEEHEVGLKLVRAAAAADVAVKRSTCVSDIKGLVELYRPNVQSLIRLARAVRVLVIEGAEEVFGG